MQQAPQSDPALPLSPDHSADGYLEGDGLEIHFRLPALPTLGELERQYILYVLDACGGDKAAAASTLGIASSTLYRKLGRYRLSELGYCRDG